MTTICIDGWNLALPHGSGIATYGHTLLEAAQRINCRTQVLYGPSVPLSGSALLDEIALISSSNRARKGGKARAISTLTSRFGRRARPVRRTGEIIWPTDGIRQPAAQDLWVAREIFHLSIRAFRQYGRFTPLDFFADGETPKPEVMHWTCPIPLHASSGLNIITIHDIIPLKLPHTTKDHKETYFRLLKQSCDRADHILAVSEHTKRDLLAVLPLPEEKITVTYQPVASPTAEPDHNVDHEWLGQSFGLSPHGYFLFYGAIEPKKNIGRIVEAYLEANSKTPLVIVGGRSWLEEYETGLLNATREYGNAPIIRADYLPRSALERLVRNARATLFPSLYEGFGLPALESMAVGTPVLAASGHALAEIVGKAGLLVDPYDPKAIRNAIISLDNDAGLRRELAKAGLARAKLFSAHNYDQRLRSAYSKVGIRPSDEAVFPSAAIGA